MAAGTPYLRVPRLGYGVPVATPRSEVLGGGFWGRLLGMRHLIFLILFVGTWAHASGERPLELKLEAGAVWQHRNDVRIPSSSGTAFGFDEFDPGPFLHYRAEVFYSISDKHSIRGVYAPFRISVDGQASKDIDFAGESFSSTSPLTVNYQFDSYRVSYIYHLWTAESSSFDIGVTGKIRNAKIELVQGSTKSPYDNLGFVPLFYFRYQHEFSDEWSFDSDLDFAAAPQGRAADLSLLLVKKIDEQKSFGLGYRTLEGGADNDKVFTFSWFNYAIAQFRMHF